jgi:hypothetical protein
VSATKATVETVKTTANVFQLGSDTVYIA